MNEAPATTIFTVQAVGRAYLMDKVSTGTPRLSRCSKYGLLTSVNHFFIETILTTLYWI
jgi:hypothetical protein